jgi:hypothetical protein
MAAGGGRSRVGSPGSPSGPLGATPSGRRRGGEAVADKAWASATAPPTVPPTGSGGRLPRSAGGLAAAPSAQQAAASARLTAGCVAVQHALRRLKRLTAPAVCAPVASWSGHGATAASRATRSSRGAVAKGVRWCCQLWSGVAEPRNTCREHYKGQSEASEIDLPTVSQPLLRQCRESYPPHSVLPARLSYNPVSPINISSLPRG